jgi:hypothetical protein
MGQRGGFGTANLKQQRRFIPTVGPERKQLLTRATMQGRLHKHSGFPKQIFVLKSCWLKSTTSA